MTQVSKSYSQLRKKVRETLVQGQAQIEALKVQVYWDTGNLIKKYLEVAPPGPRNISNILDRLAKDFNMERSIFSRMLQFSRAYPSGVVPGQLSWTHYRALIAIPGKKRRRELERKAISQIWPARRLRHEIEKSKDAKQRKSQKSTTGLLVEPVRHPASVRKVRRVEDIGTKGKFRVDLGFEVHRDILSKRARHQEGNLVVWNKKKKGWERKGNVEELYYYEAQVIRVVDGDTLFVNIDLGFEMHRRQYLRLRGLNAEAGHTKRGQKATLFLTKIVRKHPRILIRTHLTDRYDRFLADVWAGPTYLNNALLEKELAVTV